jgi:hypothetical protein
VRAADASTPRRQIGTAEAGGNTIAVAASRSVIGKKTRPPAR